MELINGNIIPVLEPNMAQDNNESKPSVDFVVTCSPLSVSQGRAGPTDLVAGWWHGDDAKASLSRGQLSGYVHQWQ